MNNPRPDLLGKQIVVIKSVEEIDCPEFKARIIGIRNNNYLCVDQDDNVWECSPDEILVES